MIGRVGKALKYGDNINTDIISPPAYMELPIEEAAKYAMYPIDPDFAKRCNPGDIFVTENNCGSGSSRETAPLALRQLGIRTILAKSYARIFYRNCINLGILAIECKDTHEISADDKLQVDYEKGIIQNLTTGKSYVCDKIPPHIIELVSSGGLISYLKKNYESFIVQEFDHKNLGGENMHSEMEMLRCAIVRGGTSKGIFILENALPKDPILRDQVILAIYGSPDLRQIDGLGGGDTLTSKLAIIGPATHPDADIDYTFGQVSITDAFVDYGGNCGNISSAVGPFAIDMGLVRIQEPVTTIRIHLTNTGRILVAEVPVKNGRAAVQGDFSIDGVPGTGAKITLDWSDVVGGITGHLLPTGQAKDFIEAGGETYSVSIVDAGNVVIFIRAEELGLKGTETPMEIDSDEKLLERIEEIRGKVCEKIGMVKHWQDAKVETPYQPFFAMVSAPTTHKCFNGVQICPDDVDVISRLTFMLKMHKAYPVTGTVATGAAARIKGSIVWDLLSDQAKQADILKIGHPSGVIPIEAKCVGDKITKLGVYRTARMIMDGYVYVRKSVYKE